MTTKVCRKCKEAKELSTDHFPRNNASKDKFDSMCKACWRLRSAERHRAGINTPAKRVQAEAKAQVKKTRGPAWKQLAANDPAPAPRQSKPNGPEPSIKGVTVHYLAGLRELPGPGVQFVQFQGASLADHVAEVRSRYEWTGQLLVHVFDPRPPFVRQYFIERPSAQNPIPREPEKRRSKNVHK